MGKAQRAGSCSARHDDLNMHSKLILLAFLVFSHTVAAQSLPAFIQEYIEEFLSAPVGDAPASIWKYSYRGDEVFYIPFVEICCDIPSEVRDSEGLLICQPEGGFTGDGDGRCQDFYQRRTKGEIVWRDPRAEATR